MLPFNYLWVTLITIVFRVDGCCMPAQWQGIEMVDVGTSVNGTNNDIKIAMNVSYDSTIKKVAVDMYIRTSAGEKTKEFVLQDYSTGIQYVVERGRCIKMPISQSDFPMQCVPKNATAVLRSFVGGGTAKIATTTYLIEFPGVGEGFLTMTDEGCYPITYEVAGRVQGVDLLETVALYGITDGIVDPSVFDVPAICKSEEFIIYVKGGKRRKIHLFGF